MSTPSTPKPNKQIRIDPVLHKRLWQYCVTNDTNLKKAVERAVLDLLSQEGKQNAA